MWLCLKGTACRILAHNLLSFFLLFTFLAFPGGVTANTTTVLQSVPIAENIGSAVAVDPNGSWYVGTVGGLYAIDEAGIKWVGQTEGEVGATPLIGVDGTVYVTSYDGSLYAFDPSDGSIIWSYSTGSEIYSSPAMDLDGVIYFGTKDGTLHAVDSITQRELWRINLGSEIGSSPSIGTNGDVYVGAADGNLYAIDASNGDIRSSYYTSGGVSSPAIDQFGNVHVGSHDHFFYSLNPQLEYLWSFDAGGRLAGAPVIGDDGALVFISYDNQTLHRVSADRQTIATFSFPSEVYSTPALASDGSIYAATVAGDVYALEYVDGTISTKWQHKYDGAVYASVTLGSGGEVLLTTTAGDFMRIENSVGGGEDAQWPMFGYDATHRSVLPDLDRDGCPDVADLYPSDPAECVDTDGDLLGDNADEDDDNDGMPDEYELANGLDSLRDDADEDLDGDGYPNAYEYEQGLNPAENEFDDRPMEVVEAHDSLHDAGELVITNDSRFVVVESGFDLVVFARNLETGGLTEVSRRSEHGVEIDRLYVAGVDVYSIGTKTTTSGYLTTKTREFRHYRVNEGGEIALVQTLTMQPWDSEAGMEPGVFYDGSSGAVSSFSVSPGGEHAYLGTGNRGIVIFDRDVTAGLLTFRKHYMNGGTSFGAGGGLVMTEDGTGLLAQFGSTQWVLNRSSDGSLSPGQRLQSDLSTTISQGTVPDHIVYLKAKYYSYRPIVEANAEGQEVASVDPGTRYGWAFVNPSRTLVYHYYNGDLQAFSRSHNGFASLSELSYPASAELSSWTRAVVSPDGAHIYATSASNDRLVVLGAGFKGIGHPDSDGDGVSDKEDDFPFDSSEWVDSDGDGVGDNTDVFPGDSSEWSDLDRDGIGDNSDTDIDGDGCQNEVDAFVTDPLECKDTDGDGIGNNSDADDDGDRLPDVWELENGLDPLDPADALLDSDGDGLTNEDEYHRYQTAANNPDTDGDSISDGWEVRYSLDPNDSQDGVYDFDNDGFNNIEESVADTNPNDPRWYPGAPGLAKWGNQVGGSVRTQAAVDADGKSYFGADDGKLHAFDPQGNPLWQLELGGAVRSSPVIGTDGYLFVGTNDGRLLKVDPNAPAEPEVLIQADAAIQTTPAVTELGMIYFGADDGAVYAIDRFGVEHWRFDTGAPVQSSPRVGSDGVIYVGSDNGDVFAIHGETGAPVE